MKRFKNILVATDASLDQHPILEEAAEIALHNGAALKIVDVVRDLPWSARITLSDHQQVYDRLIADKQQKLETLAAPLAARGLTVSVRVLQGPQSIEIIREVLRSRHDLVLRVAKGSHSRRRGFFGTTATRLLRKCPCPVWLVSPATTPKFEHVLGCVDTTSDDPADAELRDKVFEIASSISEYHGGRFSLVHTWSIWNEKMLESHMRPEDLDQWEINARQEETRRFDAFLAPHGSSTSEENVYLLKGDPTEVIPRFVQDQGVDLVVMGTVARSGLQGMIMGNTSEMILSEIACSVLALKPSTFVSPVQLDAESSAG